MLIGGLAALAARAAVWPGMDMVIAMLLGMFIGMAIHTALGLLLSPLLGMFETMLPASVIGMYGGMLFGMRDSMAAGSPTLTAAATRGAPFGAGVGLSIKGYDPSLPGAVGGAVGCNE